MIGIVAHCLRDEMTVRLALRFPQAIVSIDNRLPSVTGCADNHISTLKKLASKSRDRWNIILEDDAQPVEGFIEQAESALRQADSPIVGFYLGTGNQAGSIQQAIKPAVETAIESDACWIISDWFISTVAYAIRSDALTSVIKYLSCNHGPIDCRINDWTATKHIETWYSAPSLVDHANEQSLIGLGGDPDAHRRTPRRAHHVGTRDTWMQTSVRMARVDGWSPE